VSAKQKIMKLLRDSAPDLTIDQAIYKLDILRRIELGTAQLDRGEGIDHDEIVARWDDNAKATSDDVVAPRKRRPAGGGVVHRNRKAKPQDG
jgi:hypothetical protein